MEAHGYDIEQNIIFQDNQNVIIIEKNGKNSCNRKSKYIDICYFFVKYRVDSNDMSIEKCIRDHILTKKIPKIYREHYL